MHKILLSAFAVTLLLTGACGGGSTSGGKDMTGAPTGAYVSCVPASTGPSATTCFAFPLPDGGSAAAFCAADTADDVTWSSVSSCALPGLVGCCGMGGTWQCFFSTDNDPKTECTSDEGTWITTAP